MNGFWSVLFWFVIKNCVVLFFKDFLEFQMSHLGILPKREYINGVSFMFCVFVLVWSQIYIKIERFGIETSE